MTSEKRARCFCLLSRLTALLVLGLGYALFIRTTGWAVPCPFRWATGLLCPGCGVTRMCLSLLRLDLPGAWRANPGLLLLSPFLAVMGFRCAVRYLHTGSAALTKGEGSAVWVATGAMVLYGILRNLL